jgi:hypothetical protein
MDKREKLIDEVKARVSAHEGQAVVGVARLRRIKRAVIVREALCEYFSKPGRMRGLPASLQKGMRRLITKGGFSHV